MLSPPLDTVALNFSQSIEQMKQATAAVENTSDYVRGEIARKRAIHNKDAADLIKREYNSYYQGVLDSSLAYDDLALHDEDDLKKVCGLFALFPSHLIPVGTARSFNLPSNKRFPAANIAAVIPASRNSIAGETRQGRKNRG